MIQKTVLIILLCVSCAVAIDFGDSPVSGGSIELDEDDEIDLVCAARKCIRKCCDKNEYYSVLSNSCESFSMEFNFSNISVYDEYNFEKINDSLRDIFLLVSGMFYENITLKFSKTITPFVQVCNNLQLSDIQIYLTQSGKLYYELPNSYTRWNELDYFCVDYSVNDTVENEIVATVTYWSVVPTVSDTSLPKSNIFINCALFISSAFLFIVLLVYFILPELQNLAGKILMAYVFSLMVAFLSLASIQIDSYDADVCVNLTAVVYFFFISTFCWMNVMSFDIWWTFRGYAKARPIHRRGEKFKFGVYCLYAWGVPMLMAIALVEINNADLSYAPWFITPQIPLQGCFLEGGQKLVYLYYPMLVLILCNWTFFLMTAFNIWRLSRGTSVLESAAAGNPAAHRSQRQRLMVYLKLSVIMGTNWLLEIISFKSPKLKIWIITDAYNLLIGFAIFLIFVCKKKVYRKLLIKYYGVAKPKPQLSKSNTSSSTLESNLSQDIPLQVSQHPRGSNGRTEQKNTRTKLVV